MARSGAFGRGADPVRHSKEEAGGRTLRPTLFSLFDHLPLAPFGQTEPSQTKRDCVNSSYKVQPPMGEEQDIKE